jgi:quinol monooxygenase YgiN
MRWRREGGGRSDVLSEPNEDLFRGFGKRSPGKTQGGNRMHILVINFNLKGISEEDYRGLVEPIAPAFAGLPGLISKTWLANKETNTYGGMYVWSDREAMEAYKQTDIYKGMQANPHFENVTVTDFAVVENATRVTRGHVEVAA